MAEVSRLIKIGRAIYMGIPVKILEACPLKAGDRMAVITDGRTIAAARIDLHDIVNKAMLKQTVERTGG